MLPVEAHYFVPRETVCTGAYYRKFILTTAAQKWPWEASGKSFSFPKQCLLVTKMAFVMAFWTECIRNGLPSV